MSGSTRAITLKLDVQGAEAIQNSLRSLGTAGEESLRKLEDAVRRAAQRGGGVSALNDSVKETGSAFSGMTPKIQQAGYQIQDFAVQVQGGTSALTALAQQGSQFLGAFGPAGAIAGAILTVGILTARLFDTKLSIEEVTKANEAWKRSQDALNDALETGVQRAERMARAQRDAALTPQRAALGAADADREKASAEILRRERDLERFRQLGPGYEKEVQQAERDLAAARFTIADADQRVAEARKNIDALTGSVYGPPAAAFTGPGVDPTRSALLNSRDALANAHRLSGLNPQQRAIEQARINAEDEADKSNIQGLEREELIRNRVQAATLQQAYAIDKAAGSEAKRFAAAMRAGQTEINRSRAQLDMAQAMATADSPREAMLARQRAEIERATAGIRARAEAETDPKVKAALEDQIAQIKQMRQEAVGLEESIRNRNALWQQGQAFARQDAMRQSAGMMPDERARFLGQFSERQRIEGQGLDTTTPEALERIRQAGELAYGDEQLRKLQSFQGTVASMGDAFADAFGRAILDGKKLGDVLKDLERLVANAIIKQFIAQPLSNALGSLAGQIGGSLFGGGKPAALPAGSIDFSAGSPKFATGGIMTPFGPLPLHAYAGGGVARSPQVAIFGEGKRPEAYVPLPDGRTIPVTMNGAQGGGAVIQIDARGAEIGVEQRIDMVLARRLPAILAASRSDQARRMNLGGSDARTFGRR